MQSGGERYGMGAADVQAYLPPASGTATGAGGTVSRNSLAHLFGHPPQPTVSSDPTGLHTLQLHRPVTSTFQQAAAEQQYLEQLSTHQHQLALRGNAAQQVGNPFLHAGLQAHHTMASLFKTAGGGLSGHHEAPDTISSHSFFNMAPGQDQFKLSAYGNSQQQQQLLLGSQEGEASAAWRSDETAALLKVCSDMDPSAKAPALWDDVARKMQEMGYQRSPQRCKEKFESFHTSSYKKRKEENQRRELEFSSDFSSEGGHAGHVLEGGHTANLQTSDNYDNNNEDEDDNLIEEENINTNENPKKRKMSNHFFAPSKNFFERLTRDIIEKQEELHRAFLETIEKKDRERMVREEAYRRQEAARLDREQELRAQEVSIAASRNAALIAFLEKATGQSLSSSMSKIAGLPQAVPPLSSTPSSASAHAAASLAAALFQQQPSSDQTLLHHQALQDASDMDNSSDMNTKRWPKVEVHALIRLRSGMEPRFREAGPKAHLWQEICASMACLGFTRSPKRCKEKWENINKYFKKTKDSSKKRPENAKTCPYFHQLDTLYQRGILTSSSSGSGGKLSGKFDNLLEYNTQDEDDGFNLQNADTMQGEREVNVGEIQNAEQQARDKEMQNDQMDKFLHHHASATGLNMNAVTKKSLQVEMFVKDILDLQQQQHQKLVEEYDRMEQAHELRELERQQIKTTGALSHGSTHDNATLMALVHKLAGDSSDLSMSAPSSME